jgi:transposase
LPCGGYRMYLQCEVRRVACRHCGQVRRERLSFLAESARHTKAFAYYVGRRCRGATIKDIAEELHLDWDSVKELDKQYMRAQLARCRHAGAEGNWH